MVDAEGRIVSRIAPEEEQRLRAYLVEDTIKPSRFQMQFEEAAEKIYSLLIEDVDDQTGKVVNSNHIQFRRWHHEEAMLLYKLPFIPKLAAKQDLSEDEKKLWKEFKIEMISYALIDLHKWANHLNRDSFIDQMYVSISIVSGADPEFERKLEDFMNSDLGFVYGELWFLILHKTPSQIAKIPETDYIVINSWMKRYVQRMSELKHG